VFVTNPLILPLINESKDQTSFATNFHQFTRINLLNLRVRS